MRAKQKYRIAVGGISQETNTFSPIKTRIQDFDVSSDFSFFGGQELHEALSEKAELIPLIRAKTLPNGPVGFDDYNKLKNQFLEKLKDAGKVDGILLLLHGSMAVENIGHGGTDLIKSLRETIGNNCIIACGLDLHGNITEEFCSCCNITVAYRTAPHEDVIDTWIKAGKLLIESLENDYRPVTYIERLPLLLTGEQVTTDSEPAKSLYTKLKTIDEHEDILCSSIMVGFAWSDLPNTGASIIVSAKTESKLAQQECKKLAELFWDKRKEFTLAVFAGSTDSCINEALSSEANCNFISDSSDNVTAGAPGDSCKVLLNLLENEVTNAVVAPIASEKLTTLCLNAGEDAQVELQLETESSDTYKAFVKKIRIDEKISFAHVLINEIDVIFSNKRSVFTRPEEFLEFGVDVKKRKVIVVKLGYLFPELKAIASNAYLAITPGPSTLQLKDLNYKKLGRKVFPLYEETNYPEKG